MVDWSDNKGAVPVVLLIAIAISTLMGIGLGYKIGGGQFYLIALAGGLGLVFGLIVFPNLLTLIRWGKSINKEIKGPKEQKESSE